ncbi:MAG: hypothetical protein AUK63_878 [bacterium P3]|nr:MAG: hypothetical protein AUK63_878 [bacterium P3]KWW41504.1 MAG: hypothetical protein F083_1066 [bacterium F083]
MQILDEIENDHAVFPFNEYELMLSTFIAQGKLTYGQYQYIRQNYISRNPNLWIFEISAPRGFGEAFAQTFIRNKSSLLQAPSKELDADYHGQYDLWMEGIRIEVKASRVVDAESDEPLYRKALSSNTARPFMMNFQQLKPQCCDVFIWLAVYRDIIKIWVMNSREVVSHPDYSKGQHRGNSGNEGQLHITQYNIETLNQYVLIGDDLADAIRKASCRK